ncbi:MAG: ABC-F family ATP-binding cassette domain-containing protein [Anaerolineaceae bacterium]|nr:ABC-F family ATP-binding cassette domain-containing protein [Anaerolineaceae bacterium]
MSLISASNLGKSYGPVDLFTGLSFSIPQRGRIGLVGPNGVGKTTLLQILTGAEEPSQGEVQRARGLSSGYLPQEAHLESQRTLWDECALAFSDLIQVQAELARLEHAMADPEQAEAALEAYGRLQADFEQRGGYTFESKIRQTLMGLGFSRADEQRPLGQLSGGQRTRALLAKLLLSSPDLLLLDEPTNHLDIQAIEWLENYLRDWDGAVLVVSHDRYFLDQVATTIWEMTPGLETYHGNYSAYIRQRAERYQRRLEEYQAQQAFIEKEEEYIRRNIAGQNTRQAQGRRKRLERMLEEARLAPPPGTRRLSLNLEPAARSGDLVVRTQNLAVGYADEGRPLFYVPDLVLQRRECAAIIGPNGAGKTTLLKTLLGQISPLEGEAVLGASLHIGYFAQAHEGLHPDWTLMQEIEAVAPSMLPAQVRDYLARFLFTGDDVFKPVEVLSGGERGRLALACLALQGSNLLLLDEPTNHLDLPSQEVLQGILDGYSGTILLVSHDRYLIDALATQVWEVFPDSQQMRIFPGTYSEYKAAQQAEAAAQAETAAPRAAETPRGKAEGARPANGPSKDQLRRRQQRIQAVETHITGLEEELASVSRRLENPPADPGQVQKLGREYERLQLELDRCMQEWTQLNEDGLS